MTATATPRRYPDFVCVSSMALDRDVLAIMHTSPLTLLLYLQTRVDFGTGERTLEYDHAQASEALGIDERTVCRYFRRLVDARLIVVRRLAHGVDFSIARQPAGPPEEAVPAHPLPRPGAGWNDRSVGSPPKAGPPPAP